MKSQTVSSDIDTKGFMFQDSKEAFLKATGQHESPEHPIKRVKFKVTFYWK